MSHSRATDQATVQAQCPKGHILSVSYQPKDRDITFYCHLCDTDYRLKTPRPPAKRG